MRHVAHSGYAARENSVAAVQFPLGDGRASATGRGGVADADGQPSSTQH